jgi:hypothetical protein
VHSGSSGVGAKLGRLTVISNRRMHSQSSRVEAERAGKGPNDAGNPSPGGRRLPLAGSKGPAYDFLSARKTLQPFARRRSNTLMQSGDFARTAHPHPTRAKLMNQELIPSLGFNMNSAEEFPCLLN